MGILITGINGFVGRTLRRHLLEKGYNDITGIDLISSDHSVYAVDITDHIAVEKAINGIKPSCIFHLAGISRVDHSNPHQLYSINTIGTLNILNAALRQSHMPKVILVSSAQVYGNIPLHQQPISETTPVSPVNHYGASKSAAEQIALGIHNEAGLPVVILRPFNHIGRGQDPHFVIPKIINAFKNRDTDIELGRLSVMRDFLDVRDVVDVYTRVMEDFDDGQLFNICRGKGTIIGDLLPLLEKMTGHTIEVRQHQKLIRKAEIDQVIGDPQKVEQRYHWHPRYTLEDTLRWILDDTAST